VNPCPDRELLIGALLDGELDAANTVALESHLATCPGCATHLASLQALSGALADPVLAPPAPAALRRRVEAMLDREARPAARRWPAARAKAFWAASGAMGALAASLVLAPMVTGPPALETQLVASHIRSLQENHLIDVATSDRHVVRPWFNGRIDFAPPVPDLKAQGFPLVGGRLDYAGGRTVAAVVYKRRAHVINLFILPASGIGGGSGWTPPWARPTSYSVEHWRGGGLDFWAVSDVEGGELAQFRQVFQASHTAPR
jgi:anti-sigma factor RsiW